MKYLNVNKNINRGYRSLEVWIEAVDLFKIVKQKTDSLNSTSYKIKAQLESSSLSVSSNIAEGFDSGSDKMFIRYLNIAYGSSSEVQSLLYVILDQSYIEPEFFEELYEQIENIKNLIGGFIQYLSKNHK